MDTAEQVQELVAAFQGLTLEVQNLKTENVVLCQLVSAREHHPSDLPAMCLASEKYDGSPKKLKEFIEAYLVHFTFRARTFASNHVRVGFMVSNMVGNALAWATQRVPSANPVLQDYGAFLLLLHQIFERPEVVCSPVSRSWTVAARQGSTVRISVPIYRPLRVVS
ncbi:protein LDOC1-like [Ambystoma mexicanum]|uniref:protein LDOC1-like n=1 Tax=Ambystoma mexicanum TaxID=8296 RepID=UPI0037E93FA2